jgi:hypothetical protein
MAVVTSLASSTAQYAALSFGFLTQSRPRNARNAEASQSPVESQRATIAAAENGSNPRGAKTTIAAGIGRHLMQQTTDSIRKHTAEARIMS